MEKVINKIKLIIGRIIKKSTTRAFFLGVFLGIIICFSFIKYTLSGHLCLSLKEQTSITRRLEFCDKKQEFGKRFDKATEDFNKRWDERRDSFNKSTEDFNKRWDERKAPSNNNIKNNQSTNNDNLSEGKRNR